MQGLQIVRYSPREQKIVENIGKDAVIRFYKDPNEFYGYNGLNREVITFNQNIKTRGEFCNFDLWDKVTEGLPAKVFGPNNENVGARNGGLLTYDDMKQKMKDSRVYFYVGTQPASYTLNLIEAMMSGIPVVAIGPKHANSLNIAGDVYEIPDIIVNGFNGYVSDDVEELKTCIIKLLDNPKLAKQIGELGRQRAIELFGKETIKAQWKDFLENGNNK
jgi:glycosyltransferase involved in cell wall biosynthesis